MTTLNRILVLLGGAAIVASLAIGIVLVQTDAAGAQLQSDQDVALGLQALGDQLVAEAQEQRVALNEYLMAADAGSLARYRVAVNDEIAAAATFGDRSGADPGVAASLAALAAENAAWRAAVAEPGIAAVQSGSLVAIKAAIAVAINDSETAGAASGRFILQIDVAAAGANLAARSDALNERRVEATVFGVAIELFVAGIALFFVRRYGLNVARDNKRRAQASAERLDIAASLRTLRTQSTPAATAATITDALRHLPGVDVAAVFQFTADGLTALAIDGPPGLPIRTGQVLPDRTAGYLRERSTDGPWAERWEAAGQGGSDDLWAALGLKSRAFAPFQSGGDLIGLIGIATTDEDHGRHLVEDLPAVGEFASLAETILVPALVAGQVHERERGRIGAMIASAAFRPVFQPVVDLATGRTVGFEALTRFDDGSRPDVTFAAALRCEMGPELETATLQSALAASSSLPAGAWLSLNVSPAILSEGDTLVRLLAGNRRPVVLEVTEHEAIAAYAPLRAAMRRLGPGVRLAVDDAGAGVANFNHLVELRPDFVKIDIGLVRGVDADASRQAVVAGLIHFAAKVGCQVIAEGVETPSERATVSELGVTLGQGYLLARPAPAAAWVTAAEAPASSVPGPRPGTGLPDPRATEVRTDGAGHRRPPGRTVARPMRTSLSTGS